MMRNKSKSWIIGVITGVVIYQHAGAIRFPGMTPPAPSPPRPVNDEGSGPGPGYNGGGGEEYDDGGTLYQFSWYMGAISGAVITVSVTTW